MDLHQLTNTAQKLRHSIVTMNHHAGSGHPGGSLSMVEIATYLFFSEMNYSKENYHSELRDRFILSKGHCCLAVYAALAELGILSHDSFKSLRHIDGQLQGHPDRKRTPGIEFNSGSLAQGFSFGLGCALGAKLKNQSFRTYIVLGDGEMNEGQVWEGLMFGAHHQLDNLVAIIDYNKLQSDSYCTEVTSLEPLADKIKAFNWNCLEINGHNFHELEDAFQRARRTKKRPTCVIAHTTKGKGVSFMEDVPKWHGSLAPQGKELEQALKECAHGRREQ